MKENLLDLSGKIEDSTVCIYETIAEVADTLNISFFVVGASARDLILKYGYGIYPIRATKDIDIGVQLALWDEFNKLSNALIETGKFTKSEQAQRFLFNSIPIDIIPFGSIEDENNQIRWPPDHDTVLNVMGFNDAYKVTGCPFNKIRQPHLARILEEGKKHSLGVTNS